MTEEDAKRWLIEQLAVSRETFARLDELRQLIIAESAHQNLISGATVAHIWARHIVDSAQLLPLAGEAATGDWLDLGTGAGFPGLVIALLSPRPMILVEARRKRIEFLEALTAHFSLSHVSIYGGRIETMPNAKAAVISARAFAPLARLLTLAARFATPDTRWILPKGRGASNELALIADTWHGKFDIYPSITDDEAAILIGRSVSRRKQMS